MTNVLTVFAAGPAGQTHPSQSNLAELGIHAGLHRRRLISPGRRSSDVDDA